MINALHEGLIRFLRNPLREVLVAACFLVAAMTGLFLGIGALLYNVYLLPKENLDPVTLQFQLIQRFRGTRRVNTAFWLGILIWMFAVLPSWQNMFMGIPISWFLVQPFWFALLLTDTYDLSLPIALKATMHFIFNKPLIALQIGILGLIAFSGIFCFGIGICFTLPIALFATHQQMNRYRHEISLSIQRAYTGQL